MKTLKEVMLSSINETEENSLYLTKEDDNKLVIDLTKLDIKNFGNITMSYDNYGGLYFTGNKKYLDALKDAIENETNYSEQ